MNQPNNAFILRPFPHIVVIVIELGVRVGLAGVFKGLEYMVLADNLEPFAFSEPAVRCNGFVNNVPAVNSAFVATHYGEDVLFHSFKQRLAAQEFARLVLEHPVRRLSKPDEIVADYMHFVFLTQSHKTVHRFEIISVRFRMNFFPFQNIFRRDAVKVFFHKGHGVRFIAGNLI